MNLNQWGFAHWFNSLPLEEQTPITIGTGDLARVTGIHRKRIDVQTEAGPKTADFGLSNNVEQIAVGDWVNCRVHPSTKLVINAVLFRTSFLSRIASGPRKFIQPLASNIDNVLILAAMDQTFNVARIERFLAAAWISGIKPVVVLTKADTVSSTLPYEEATLDIALNTPVVALNAHDTDTNGALAPFLKPGCTSTMIGLSGAGKSTLTNTLAGNHVMTTRSVRAFDDKGRHTTTHRQLVRLPKERGLLIDSPGVREMQVWYDPAIASRVFAQIREEALHCKFSNCQHDTEQQCAVKRKADENGDFNLIFEKYKKVIRITGNILF